MNDYCNMIITGLFDMGCEQSAIDEACVLMNSGHTEDLIKHLRRYRCELMDQMHKSQKRVDCMDYLIRQVSRTTDIK